jgi:hypothetical protein
MAKMILSHAKLILTTFFAVAYLVPPVLIVLAYRAWIKSDRKSVPRWRNVIAMAALWLILAEWLILIGFVLASLLHLDTSSLFELGALLNCLVSLVGTLMSLVMKGSPRLQAVAAGSLITTIWILSASVA